LGDFIRDPFPAANMTMVREFTIEAPVNNGRNFIRI
jgi:hypothetical protein